MNIQTIKVTNVDKVQLIKVTNAQNIVVNFDLQEKSVIPTEEQQVIKPDENYDALSQVIIESIPETYIETSGILDITANGEYDVKKYEKANVKTSGVDINDYFNLDVINYEETEINWYAIAESKYLVNEEKNKAMVCNDNKEILMVDINEKDNYYSKWETKQSGSAYSIKNIDLNLYLRNNGGVLELSTTATNWTNTSDRIYSRSSTTSYYLKEENGYVVTGGGSTNAIIFLGIIPKGEQLNDADMSYFAQRFFIKKMPDLIIPNYITKINSLMQGINLTKAPKIICDNNVTSASDLYNDCARLTEIDMTGINAENIKVMSYMFSGCSAVKKINLEAFNTENATNMSFMFERCLKMKKIDVDNFNTSKVNNMKSMFSGCTELTELNVSNFDTRNVTDLTAMFYNCGNLLDLDLSSWIVSKITSLYTTFYGCEKITNLDLKGFDTSLVTTMQQAFYNCESLTNLDVSNFDTSKVTTMHTMFYGCASLESLDLSSFETPVLTNLYQTFYNCKALKFLDIRNFDFTKVTSSTNMFGTSASYGPPNDCLIIVKDDTAKTWITSKFSRLTNVKTIAEYEAE